MPWVPNCPPACTEIEADPLKRQRDNGRMAGDELSCCCAQDGGAIDQARAAEKEGTQTTSDALSLAQRPPYPSNMLRHG
jgi:hypothetical protein